MTNEEKRDNLKTGKRTALDHHPSLAHLMNNSAVTSKQSKFAAYTDTKEKERMQYYDMKRQTHKPVGKLRESRAMVFFNKSERVNFV